MPVFGLFDFMSFYLCDSVVAEADLCKIYFQGPPSAGLQLALSRRRNWQDTRGEEREEGGCVCVLHLPLARPAVVSASTR